MPMNGEGLRKGWYMHTMEFFSAILRRMNLTAWEEKEARHRRHILHASLYMKFQNRQKFPVVTEVRTHWSLWGLAATQEAQGNLLG